MKETNLAGHFALLCRALPRKDGRIGPLCHLQCGGGDLCPIWACIKSFACSWSGGPIGRVFCFWCGVCLAGYAVKVAGYALSTTLAHVSAYTILEGLRLRAADQLMGAPLGEVESRPIGAMKSTIVDRIEDVEPPLAT